MFVTAKNPYLTYSVAPRVFLILVLEVEHLRTYSFYKVTIESFNT